MGLIKVRYRGAIWDAEVVLDGNNRPIAYQIYGWPVAAPASGYHLVPAWQVEVIPPLQITVSSPAISEGNAGTTPFIFTVAISPQAQTVTLNYATRDITALAGADYQAVSGTLLFTPGETTKTVTVTVTGDASVEPNETFWLEVQPTDLLLPPVRGLGTIINDDTTVPNRMGGLGDVFPVNLVLDLVGWVSDRIHDAGQRLKP